VSAQLRHGPRLGVSVASQTAGALFRWSGLPKVGPIIGWSFDIPYTHQVGIRVEPMVMSKGSWTRNDALNQNSLVTLRYLELPVLVRLDLDTTRGGFFLNGGAIFGYWLSGKFVQKQGGSVVNEITYDLSNANKRTQWSIALGLGSQAKAWSWEIRAQSSVDPFNTLIPSRSLVYALHLTYWLPSNAERKAKRDAKAAAEGESTE